MDVFILCKNRAKVNLFFMKLLLQEYAAYNLWAHNRLLEVILSLPEETTRANATSSFPSLYQTVLHLLDAESIWWQRIKLQETITRPIDMFTGTMAQLAVQLQQQSKQWEDWVNNTTEAGLQHEFIYQNTKKEQFKQPVYQVLTHLFNHGTYHHGQIVAQLRQLGIDKIPATDFIVWSRGKK
jgi:uncharacterized damage-inducible protein DinB